ncbi:glutaredoxin domain-containing protein [Mycobacterium malmoense]|uniref:glutaredoxin domain-containing protein n=1 Tax=Mycobacterium malmoense TaxID=1780 RepID=UPI0008F8E9E3|nr:glutaredoxin domain-containing protein [Mycobacterium malmoense]OIN80759.1 hypothetical protein BMG05_10455 [Mycobacterium malmoense]
MTAPAVTVYTAGPGCAACNATKRHLERCGIAYEELPADEPDTREALIYLGFTSAPVVVAVTGDRETAWQGYRPDRIDALAVVS